MTDITGENALALSAHDESYDPIEDRLRAMVRRTIETMFEEELAEALGRARYGRGDKARGYRNGHRNRQLVGTFGTETRGRIEDADGKVREWRSKALPRYRRLTKKAEALIASVYLSGTNTRRVKRALSALFEGAVSKDVVSRTWRKVKVDWDAWCARSLADEDIVRFARSLGRIAFAGSLLDGTVVRTRIDKRATNVSILAAIGVRRDGQKVLLSIRNMGGESRAAWAGFLGDLDARDLRAPEFVVVDGAPGLEAALTELWGEDLPIQRCTVHKHRNLLAHAPKHLHTEIGEDYRDMIHAATTEEVAKRRKAFLRKWRLKCRAVADSLEGEGGPWPQLRPRKPPERRPAVHLHTPAVVAMEGGADHQRHRTPERGIPSAHQNADGAPRARHRPDAALGPARVRPDPDAESRWMGNPQSAAGTRRP